MALKDDVVAKVTEKLSQLSASQIDEFVSRAEEHFLTITKRLEVPPRALWLWVDLSTAFYNDSIGSSGNVTSIKRGDTTIAYSENPNSLSNVQTLRNKINSYKVVIAR